MKIDVSGAYRAYSQNSLPQHQRDGGRREKSVENRDRVSISSAAPKSDVDRLVYTTAAQVEAKGSPARVQELKQAVAAGQYQVPAEKLADALLSAYV